jgi:hypothetical protein
MIVGGQVFHDFKYSFHLQDTLFRCFKLRRYRCLIITFTTTTTTTTGAGKLNKYSD